MLIKKTPAWAIPESQATPEELFLNRRALIKGIAAGSILAAGAPLLAPGRAAAATDPTADLYPAPRNERYKLDRAVTSEKLVPPTTISTSSARTRRFPSWPKNSRSAPGK